MGPLLALASALVLAFVPTALFLGLWYGLMALRDDELVERAREMQAQRATYATGSSPSPGSGSPSASPADPETGVVCPHCGNRNVAGMNYCWHCLDSLE
jgi:hypothetical protein